MLAGAQVPRSLLQKMLSIDDVISISSARFSRAPQGKRGLGDSLLFFCHVSQICMENVLLHPERAWQHVPD